MNLNDLASFVRVVELGTIAAAADAEGVPRSTITRRIARLEKTLEVELLRRASRSFTITDDGHRLHQLSSAAMRQLTDVQRAFSATSDVPRGRLVISAPDFARSEPFAALVQRYRAQYPEVSVELRLENRVVDLVHEGVDVSIRAHVGNIPGTGDLMSRVFGLPPMGWYASPGYVETHEMPKEPQGLLRHALIVHSAGVGVPKTLESGERTEVLDVGLPALHTNDTMAVRTLTEASAGVGLLPEFVAASSVARGTLRRVLPEWSMKSAQIAVVWRASRHLAPRVRVFLELAAEQFGEPG